MTNKINTQEPFDPEADPQIIESIIRDVGNPEQIASIWQEAFHSNPILFRILDQELAKLFPNKDDRNLIILGALILEEFEARTLSTDPDMRDFSAQLQEIRDLPSTNEI